VSAIAVRELFRVHSTPEGDAAALQGLTLDVDEGEVLAVLGPSGAGKTSLLQILAGLDRPSAGRVRVFGTELTALSSHALARYRSDVVGYVEQRYAEALDANRSLVDAVALRLRLDGERDPASRASELLETVGLGARLDAQPPELSGGEQQRVAVCAALAHRPRLLLADEPTGELDRAAADAIFALIRELARSQGTTVVVVSHDARAPAFADRAVRIRDGRVSEEQRDGAEQVVVGRGGWIRVPEELLRAAGVRDRARVGLEGRRIVLAAASERREVGRASAAPAVRHARRDGVVRLRGVTKRFGDRVVLASLDADADGGALTVVTGPSGSGKTTLLDLVVGLESAEDGAVVVAGTEVTKLDRDGRAALRRAHVGYVAQQPVLVPFLSARENVELALSLRGSRGDPLELLEAVGLTERAEQRTDRLSAGEQLRVAIARALAPAPEVLVADEPTSRLDEPNAHAVAALLRRLAHEHGAAVVVASHDPVVVEQADEQIVLG
jgi:ABC-type lipoprotein export system ATPase subunit